MRQLNVLVALAVLVTSACAGTPSRPNSFKLATGTAQRASTTLSVSTSMALPTLPSGGVNAEVLDVVDGDTIQVMIRSQAYSVRYIGVNTPEITFGKNEPFGQEARDYNARLVSGQTVYLVKDVSETDRYGRLLRYVFVGDTFVNAELVRQGFAQVATYPPDVAYQDLFLQLQRAAEAAGRGLWGATSALPTAAKGTVPAPTLPPTRSAGVGCDPAYPTVCLAPPPPDLDCSEITYRRFQVLAPDPHGFDGDNDGIGCESG